MQVIIEIPKYNESTGIEYAWSDGFTIRVQLIDEMVKVSANKAGLESLANHLLNLAQNSVPVGSHLHFDEYNSLEDGSAELILEKVSN